MEGKKYSMKTPRMVHVDTERKSGQLDFIRSQKEFMQNRGLFDLIEDRDQLETSLMNDSQEYAGGETYAYHIIDKRETQKRLSPEKERLIAMETIKQAIIPSDQPPNAQPPKKQRIRRKRRVPPLMQMSQVECGLACLAMILCYYGRKTSISELRTRYGVGRDGISALSIVKAARNYGMRVRAISLQQSEFRHVTLPAIVHWEFNHFVVVEHWTRKAVGIVDPAVGYRKLTHKEFDAGFTGVVIMLEPGADFDAQSASSPLSLKSYVRQAIHLAPGTMLQVLGASVLLQIFGLMLPLTTKVVFDQILPFRMTNVMVLLGIGLILILCAQSVTTLLREWLLVHLRARLDIQMMLGFFEHLLTLPYSFFQQRSSGDLLTRFASNTTVRDILSSQLVATLLDSSMVIIYLFIILWQAPLFAALTVGVGLFQVFITLGTSRVVRSLASRELIAQAKSQGYMAEALAGMSTIKAAGAEQRAQDRWSDLFTDQLNVSIRRNYVTSIISTLLSALHSFSPLALLWVGTMQVLNGTLSVGTMLALNALATAFLEPLSSLVGRIQQIQVAQAHLDRLADVMTTESEQDTQRAQVPPQLTGHIHLRNVGFQYAPDMPKVLHEINVTIQSGQKVAIVGRTGSGKSTLGKLLLGLYVPTEGDIFYDNIPLRVLQYQEVRRQFGVVMQDAAIFSGTIRDNIALNQPTMSKEQIFRAAKIAAIHEDIVCMPLSYETHISEGGSALSGGQRQRLAIARAVAHYPAILLLDEATSHLDVVTEQKVSQQLEALSCTQIIIAHRLSTIRNADVILVIEQGTIVEQGSHEELLRKSGYYARLIQQQMEDERRRVL